MEDQVNQDYENMQFREVTKKAFFILKNYREDYLLNIGSRGMTRGLFLSYVICQLQMIWPITPHLSEFLWKGLFDSKLKPGLTENIEDYAVEG